ncbi:MAG: SGNH/GDSL hydrolase family protein [Luteolibacter sp.]
MNHPSHSRLLFIGDSITDAGRGPAGEVCPWEPYFGLGQGYVSMTQEWLHAAHPDAAIRVLNQGVSGNTIRDLAARWETDVLAHTPDVLCIMIGINDVWRQFDSPLRLELAVGPEEYRETLASLVAKAGPSVKAIHLASPYFIEPHPIDTMRTRMDQYGEIVRQTAASSNASFIDTQAAFDRVLTHTHPASLAWDRIHPGHVGHMIIARAFLQSFGCI